MVQIAEEIGCPDCGAPLKVKVGEAIITCEYCGSDVNMAVGKKYFLKHSIIPARYDNKNRIIFDEMKLKNALTTPQAFSFEYVNKVMIPQAV